MKKVYTLLAVGILVGLVVVLVDPKKTTEQSSSSGAEHALTSADKSALSAQSAAMEHIVQTKSKRSVGSPEKVVSVREAYRQALKDEEKKSLPANVNPPTGETNETSPDLATETAAAPFTPAVGAEPPDEPVVIDQPRLWLPAAMLEPDQSIAITSELQVAEWEQLQEDFVQAVDGRAPSSETEKEAWIRAQQENDDLFRAKFGWDAFRQQQLKAYMEGLAPAPPQ